jgi:ATP-dependent DNA helicase RecQ
VFERLRESRRRIAADSGVPPYVVFHDSTLRDIAAARPRDLSELAQIQGVGETKLKRYGQAMLDALNEEIADGAPA